MKTLGTHSPHPYDRDGKTLLHGEEGFFCDDCIMEYAVQAGVVIYDNHPCDRGEIASLIRGVEQEHVIFNSNYTATPYEGCTPSEKAILHAIFKD